MADAALVRVLDGVGNGGEQGGYIFGTGRTLPAPLARLDALDELGDQEPGRPLPAVLEQLHDSRMAKPADGVRLALEAGQRLGLVDPAGVEHLDGDAALHVGVEGQIDDAKAAGAPVRGSIRYGPIC